MDESGESTLPSPPVSSERLALEMEKLGLERMRLEAARKSLEDSERLSQNRRSSLRFTAAAAVILAFAAGMVCGIAFDKWCVERSEKARLDMALKGLENAETQKESVPSPDASAVGTNVIQSISIR